MTTFECSVSFTYDSDNPAEAARQLIANIQNNPNWYVNVMEVKPDGKSYTVDTETGEVEEN